MGKLKVKYKGYLYRRTRMNAIATLFWATALIVLYVMYMRGAAIYFPNAVSSGHALVEQTFAADTHALEIEPQSEPFDCAAYGVTTPPMLRLDEVYRSGMYYRFKFIPDAVRETGIGYTAATDGSRLLVEQNADGSYPESVENRIMVVTIGENEYAAIVPTYIDPEAGIPVQKAVFIELPMYIGHDLGLTAEAGGTLSNWCLDLRGIAVDDEGGDFALIIIFTLLFPAFFVYTLACVINPRLHINYVVLAHFAEDLDAVCRQIDAELAEDGVYKERKQVYTKRYILRETLYTTRVMKNHTYRN